MGQTNPIPPAANQTDYWKKQATEKAEAYQPPTPAYQPKPEPAPAKAPEYAPPPPTPTQPTLEIAKTVPQKNEYQEALIAELEAGNQKVADANSNIFKQQAADKQAGAAASTQPTTPSTALTTPPPAGYDPTKWNDPNHQTPKYVAGRIIAGGGTAADVAQALGGRLVEGSLDKIWWFDPSIGREIIVDVIQGASAGLNNPFWNPHYNYETGFDWSSTGVDTSVPQPGAPSVAGGGATGGGGGGGGIQSFIDGIFGSGGGGGGGGSTSSSTSTSTSGSGLSDRTTRADELYELLNDRARQGLNITGSDPIIRNQTEAYSAEQERARRLYLGELAEGGSPYSTGFMGGQQRLTVEEMGSNVSGFQATLLANELTARRAEIQASLEQMGSLLTEQERITLQQQLAQLDAAIQMARLQQQAYEFDASDEFRRSPLAS